ncbi:hypothetical protein C480_20579 [Natrialba aegyptia DSM 13077]|uniref:Uncharacterized protein n=1 Tax=Natrialba aegyptia DSM 13077 TaxID=1227491 RepID=M0AKD8_9EURY|nr:hypothetical protein C480_20579 [Natrialba aegyptia DSM 13077]
MYKRQLVELSLLRELFDAPLDVVVPVFDEFWFDVTDRDVVAAEGGDFGDTVTHATGSKNRYSLDCLARHHGLLCHTST